MKVLFVTSEALPYFKTGGLADVARALPDALAERGHDVRVFMPRYEFLGEHTASARTDVELAVPWPGGVRRASTALITPERGAPTAFLLAQSLFDTDRPYDPLPGDELSLGRRFAFFCRAAVAYARAWGADVMHLNDWQTGLVPLYALIDGVDIASLFAIHNLAYQGNFPPQLLGEIGIPASFQRTENGLEFHGTTSFMKGALALADRLVTVSPTYAREVQTGEYGAGLDGLLKFRRRTLHGVLNGIDTALWNPSTDPLLPTRYTARSLTLKAQCRAELVRATGLAGDGAIFGIVSRLAHQKGIDLLIETLPDLVERGHNVVMLGNGDARMERTLGEFAKRHPRQFAVRFGFDEPLAHLIYAGADLFLMPSLYEPCGLGQMIAQRYGTPPVARRTGGLADTIADGSTGFLFDDPTPTALLAAIDRAAAARARRGWRAMQTRCMREDHSWTRSAADYERLYHVATGALSRLDATTAQH